MTLPKPANPTTSYPCPPPPEIILSNSKIPLDYPLSKSCPFSTTPTAAGGGWMGWRVVVITRIKANLSSTEHGFLTSQLELSLAMKSVSTCLRNTHVHGELEIQKFYFVYPPIKKLWTKQKISLK